MKERKILTMKLNAADPEIKIKVNEKEFVLKGNVTLGDIVSEFKPGADILLVNGIPTVHGTVLKHGDVVVIIMRGEIPSKSELEYLMVSRHTAGVHAKLKKATIGIAGLGGLGSHTAIALARVGIGKLIIADYDVVEPSNLNRQQYGIRHIGIKKTEALKDILEQINPYMKIYARDIILDQFNIPEIFQTADIIIECLDSAESKSILIRSALSGLPKAYVIGASGVAGFGKSNDIRSIRLSNKLFMVGDFKTGAGPGSGLMAPRVGIAAYHQANLAISILMHKLNFL